MKLAVFQEVIEVGSLDELKASLCFRHNTIYGSFWLWHPEGTELAIMINDGDAHLMFTTANGPPQEFPSLGTRIAMPVTYKDPPGEGPSFYVSYSQNTGCPEEEIEFLADNYEPIFVQRLHATPLQDALKAVGDFFESGQRSECIHWHCLEFSPAPLPKPGKPWWRLW